MCPRSPEQSAILRQKSRTAILHAATELFARKGYAATKTEEIAKRAGVSKGLIYNHFTSKESILETLLESLTESTLGLRTLQEGSVESRAAALIAFIHTWFGEIRTNPALVKLGIQFHSDPAMIRIARKKQDELMERYLGVFSTLFRDLGSSDPEAETFLLGSLLDGIGLNYTAMPESIPLDRIEALIVGYYSSLRGVPA